MTTPLATLIYRILPLACLTMLLAACALPPTAAPPSGNLTLDLRRLQASFDHQKQALADLSGQVAAMENRLQRQGEELEMLREAVPRTRAGEPGLPTPSADGLAPSAQAEGSPTEIYLQAFGDYASGRFQAAIAGFTTFLTRFPNNSYASNAQFWLGDCYFNQQQYAQAIAAFEQLLADYPNAPKSPDALLKMAVAHLQLGAPEQARQAVDTLGQRYPNSTAVQKARELTIP